MMNNRSRIMRRQRWVCSALLARTAAAILAVLALAPLAVACGGARSPSAGLSGPGGSPSASGTADSPSAVAYSSCMRSHGVPEFPDPTSSGAVPKGSAPEFGVSSTAYHAAQTTCQHLYPDSSASIQQCEMTGECPQAL